MHYNDKTLATGSFRHTSFVRKIIIVVFYTHVVTCISNYYEHILLYRLHFSHVYICVTSYKALVYHQDHLCYLLCFAAFYCLANGSFTSVAKILPDKNSIFHNVDAQISDDNDLHATMICMRQ